MRFILNCFVYSFVGCSLTPQTLDNVFLELAKIASHRVLISIFTQLNRYKISISTISLNAMINACEKAGDYSAALELYDNKISFEKIDEVGVSVLVKCCDRLRLPVKAVRILLQSIFEGKTISMSLKERVFAILVNCKMVSTAVNLLLFLELQHNRPGLISDDLKLTLMSGDYNTYLDDDIAANIDDCIHLNELIDLTDEVTQSAGIYAAVIACLASVGNSKEAYEILDSYIRRGGVETSEMYVSVISGFKQNRNVDAAELVFTQLKYRLNRSKNMQGPECVLQPLKIETAHYNALLSVYSAADLLTDHSPRIIAEMSSLGLKWDSHTFTALILGSPYDEALTIWDGMISHDVIPSQASIRKGLKAVVRKVAAGMGMRIYHHARKHGVAFEPYDYVLLFTALRGGRKTDEAVKLLNDLHEEDTHVPAICYHSVMHTLDRINDWRRSIHLLLQMIRRGIPFDAKLFNVVMACCTRSCEYSLALKLFDQIKALTKGKFIPNHSTFSLAVLASTRMNEGAKAISLLHTMKGLCIPPSTRVLSNVIACLDSCAMYEECVQVYNECVAKPTCDSEGFHSNSVIDLHGFSIHTSKAAILSSLFSARESRVFAEEARDIVIITGILGALFCELTQPIIRYREE